MRLSVRLDLIVLIGLALIFLFVNNATGSSIFQNSISTRPDFLTYVNSTYGIKIQFPSNWDLQEIGNILSNPSIITIIRFTPSLDIDRSLGTDPSDGNTYVDINEQKGFRNMSLDSLMKNNIDIIKNDNTTSDFKLISTTTDGILAGQKAYTLVYASTYNGFKAITMSSVTLYGGKIYSVTFSAEQSKYAEFVQTAQKMFESFKLMVKS
jgi:eukaryotic-like serine/threonine-protein kinase